MNTTILRRRYTQLFVIGFLCLSAYILSQSLAGGLTKFEANLWGRKLLVANFTELKLKIGDRVFSQALVGEQGWLEYTGSGNLDGYQNAGEFSPETLAGMQKRIQTLYKQLRKRNITLVLIIPPNKATIYPDKVPDQIQKIGAQSNLDVFAAYMQQHGPQVLVDLRPALQAGREKQDVYYKTDTHWNPFGAFIAYSEVMQEISKTYPQLDAHRIEDFKITSRKPSLHDIVRITGVTNLQEPGFNFKLKKKDEAPKDNLPTLLMYADSFGMGLRPFLSPHFRKMTVIRIDSKSPGAISLEKLDTVKPDIVIVEIVERSFNIYVLDTFLKQMLSGRN